MITYEEIQKLPKWAQGKINNLVRERDEASSKLTRFLDLQTPSEIYSEELLTAGLNNDGKELSFAKRYVQGHHLTIEHDGVKLDILLREGCIDLSWQGKYHSQDVAMIPCSYQQVYLVAKENMYPQEEKSNG